MTQKCYPKGLSSAISLEPACRAQNAGLESTACSRFIESGAKDDLFIAEAKAAFQVLVNALVEQQNAGDIRRDDPVLMARFVWALVHGTALLFIDGQLPEPAQRAALEPYLAERIYASIRQPT